MSACLLAGRRHWNRHYFADNLMNATRISLVVALAIFCTSCASTRVASDLVEIDGLGAISFPNSGDEVAQDAFYRGVLNLHSFEFGPANEAFREAQRLDPDFYLAHWGEALTYNYPLWRSVNLEKAREELSELAATPEERLAMAPTERERMYFEAVEALYGEGEKSERDAAYMEAMKRLHEAYPEDDEATTFYALSVLGSLNGERDYEVYGKAASIAQPVFERNPMHPGAAHYIIHSYDDPEHATLGLDAANAYADIAPEAAHAQHMTTHIFVALGMWERVVENNIRAMNTQNADRAAAGDPPNNCGHYSSWRHYGHLQLGELDEAEMLMDACYETVSSGDASRGSWLYFASMRSLHIIDTEDWSLAARWQAEPPVFDTGNNADGSVQGINTYQFGNAFAAMRRGDKSRATSILNKMDVKTGGDEVLTKELEGLLKISAGLTDEGLAILREAAEQEASFPMMFGPPEIVKPGYELLGEELYRAGRAEEAKEAYDKALQRTPGRKVTVQGSKMAAKGTH